jgi:hypothetical protein
LRVLAAPIFFLPLLRHFEYGPWRRVLAEMILGIALGLGLAALFACWLNP